MLRVQCCTRRPPVFHQLPGQRPFGSNAATCHIVVSSSNKDQGLWRSPHYVLPSGAAVWVWGVCGWGVWGVCVVCVSHKQLLRYVPIKPEGNLWLVTIEVVGCYAGNGLHIGSIHFQHIIIIFDSRDQLSQSLQGGWGIIHRSSVLPYKAMTTCIHKWKVLLKRSEHNLFIPPSKLIFWNQSDANINS